MQKPQALGLQCRTEHTHACDVAPGPIDARDDTGLHRIGGADEDNRNRRVDGGTLHLPNRSKDRPDRERLALRFERFKEAT